MTPRLSIHIDATYQSPLNGAQCVSACMDLLARNLRLERGRKIVGTMV
ncbi:MAG: hypothetical protein O9247_01410 [Rhodobacteraceae bacterium]|nr:hypothetical protein [Paracoccaceae bacterium]